MAQSAGRHVNEILLILRVECSGTSIGVNIV